MKKNNLFKNGMDKYEKPYIYLENILIILQIFLGFICMFPVRIAGIPVVSILYISFNIIMLLFPLRKHLCTHCYYYGKQCHCGWGKLASALYKKGSGTQKIGGILAAVTWGNIMLLPIIVTIILMISEKTFFIDQLIFFVPFFITVIINGALHKADCEKCKMKFICPGSAAK